MARPRKGQATVGEVLEGAIRGLQTASRIRESLAFAYWDEAVGPQAAAATEPESVRDGILFVRTKSSVWSHELTLLKAQILLQLNARLGKPLIQDIVFRASRGVRRGERTAGPEAEPTDEDLAGVQLSAEESEALQTEVGEARSIANEALRTAVTSRIVRLRRLRRWRLDHGWKQCARCTAVHRDEGVLCPICRVCR